MAYEQTKLLELVERAVNHRWSIPEFQRGFVWKPTQVRDLAESLWLDFPIGSLLVWNSQQPTEERIVRDAQRPTQAGQVWGSASRPIISQFGCAVGMRGKGQSWREFPASLYKRIPSGHRDDRTTLRRRPPRKTAPFS